MTKDRKLKVYRAVLLFAISALPLASSMAGDSLVEGLSHCSSVEEDTARLACFDELSGTQPDTTESSGQAVLVTSNSDLGSESVRSESVRSEREENAEDVSTQATVTKCLKGSNNRYTFYFADGQVWRQTDGKRLRYDDCAFKVTVTKDFFGYKMQEDGEKSRIRVTRVK